MAGPTTTGEGEGLVPRGGSTVTAPAMHTRLPAGAAVQFCSVGGVEELSRVSACGIDGGVGLRMRDAGWVGGVLLGATVRCWCQQSSLLTRE